MKRLISLITLAALWLAIGVSCRDSQPKYASCRDATCCGAVNGILYDYDEVVAGEPVVFAGPPYGSWGVSFNRQVPRGYTLARSRSAKLYDLCLDKFKDYPYSLIPGDTTFRPNYRVWGRIYTGSEMPTLVVGPPRFIYIERLEKIAQ